MTAISYFGYALGLLFYPARFALYTLQRVLVFLTKPAAPAAVAILCFPVAGYIYSNDLGLQAGLDNFFYQFQSSELYQQRYLIFLVFCTLGAALIAFILSRLLRPIVATLPAPRLPLLPLPPLVVKEHKIEAMPARVVPAKHPSTFTGDLAVMQPLLPEEIAAILSPARTSPKEPPKPATPPPADDVIIMPPPNGGSAPSPVNEERSSTQSTQRATMADLASASSPETGEPTRKKQPEPSQTREGDKQRKRELEEPANDDAPGKTEEPANPKPSPRRRQRFETPIPPSEAQPRKRQEPSPWARSPGEDSRQPQQGVVSRPAEPAEKHAPEQDDP